MITPRRLAGLLALALCLMGAVAASSASAAFPEFWYNCHKLAGNTGKYTEAKCETESATHTGAYDTEPVPAGGAGITFTDKSGAQELRTKEHLPIKCKASTSSGKVTGPKTVGGLVVKYTGCTLVVGTNTLKCHSVAVTNKKEEKEGTAGANEEEIVTNTVEGEIYFEKVGEGAANEKIVLMALKPTAPAERFVSIKCSTQSIAVLGSVIGEVTPLNKYQETGKLIFEANAANTGQKYVFLANGKTEDHLEAFAEPAWLVSTDEIMFSRPIEVRTKA